MSGESMERAEQKIRDLEAEVRIQGNRIETLQEALDGAHRVIRQLRDKDSELPALDNSAPIP